MPSSGPTSTPWPWTTAKARGWDRFHLVGYSGGGSVALALTAAHPERLWSVALLEPAWAGNWDDVSQAHRTLWHEYARLSDLPQDDFMAAFMRLQLRPDVVPPSPTPGPPPPWMSQRPAGIRALLDSFQTYDLDREALRAFEQPAYFALGGLSNPDQFGEEAERLARVFPNFWLEVFPERHHFDPPHRVEPQALATSLRSSGGRRRCHSAPRHLRGGWPDALDREGFWQAGDAGRR